MCKNNVEGLRCNRCSTHTYNLSSANATHGCQPCHCDTWAPCLQPLCDPVSGQCVCLPMRYGRDCGTCKPGWCFQSDLNISYHVCIYKVDGVFSKLIILCWQCQWSHRFCCLPWFLAIAHRIWSICVTSFELQSALFFFLTNDSLAFCSWLCKLLHCFVIPFSLDCAWELSVFGSHFGRWRLASIATGNNSSCTLNQPPHWLLGQRWPHDLKCSSGGGNVCTSLFFAA